jgi:Phosphoglucomutase/phosphomannomutase, alpha/beta/alpha domain I
MSRSLFGTDGVRGLANSEPMTAEIAMRIGMAAGQVFNRGGHRHRVVIGKDTRLSGYMIEQALTAGFLSVGVDVLLLGPLPTPAVGFLTRSMRADVGVMISASHNPYEDNGIKLFGPDGFKLSDAIEMQIESLVAASSRICLAASAAIGRQRHHDGGVRGRCRLLVGGAAGHPATPAEADDHAGYGTDDGAHTMGLVFVGNRMANPFRAGARPAARCTHDRVADDQQERKSGNRMGGYEPVARG